MSTVLITRTSGNCKPISDEKVFSPSALSGRKPVSPISEPANWVSPDSTKVLALPPP